jgi:phosphatidylinositol-3-phosphatase
MGRRSIFVAAALIACLATASSLRAAAAPHIGDSERTSSSALEGVPRFGHVFVIVGENTTYSHLNLTNAPYLMGNLRPRSAWLTGYRAATHWSQANYIALTSGRFTRCEQQDYGAACHDDVNNIYHQLDVTHQTWTTWLEGGTAKCDTGSGSTCPPQGPCPLTGFYTTGNPPINYADIEGEGGVWSATHRSQECLQNDIYAGPEDAPMGDFNHALSSGEVPAFNLVLPNGCEDGEGNCKPTNNRYRQFDDFLAREVPKIEASPAFGNDGVIVITYDEDQRKDGLAKKHGFGSGGPVVCAILSPLVRSGEYGRPHYHYSLLRTLEDGFGLSHYVGHANDVDPISEIWK